MRIYDRRAGRFLSVDPLYKNFPWNSVYAFAENDVLRNVDLDGAEKLNYIKKLPTNTGTWVDRVNAFDNGAINIANLVPEAWNSLVETYNSVKRGTLVSDVKRDATATIDQVKSTAINSWNYTVNTPVTTQFSDAVSPNSIELYSTLFLGSKIPGFPTQKGSQLSLTPTTPNVALGLEAIPNSSGGWNRILRNFSEKNLSFNHKQWSTTFGNIATGESFESIFKNVLDHVTKTGGKIKFDVTGFDWTRVAGDFGKSLKDALVLY